MIVVDIGNTNLHFALERGGKVIKNIRIETSKADMKTISSVIFKYPGEKIMICSVVPKLTTIFQRLKQKNKRLCNKICVAGEDIKIPIKSFYDRKSIGMDRLVGAFGAKEMYRRVRLIIDFGTAITVDFLSKKGEYEGGFILPGIGSTLKVFSTCALLPDKINIGGHKRSRVKIPRTTSESILRGVEEGFSAMINTLVKKYRKDLAMTAGEIIVITGGESAVIKPHLTFSYVWEPHLVLKGLRLLADKYF